MELKQHIGVLAIFIVIGYLRYIWDEDRESGYEAYLPLLGAIFLWCVFEAFYWIIVLLIV